MLWLTVLSRLVALLVGEGGAQYSSLSPNSLHLNPDDYAIWRIL